MNEILNDVFSLLDVHFPDTVNATGPAWNQSNYKMDWFRVFLRSRGHGSDASADEVRREGFERWIIQRTDSLPSHQLDELRAIFFAWREWEYAFRQLFETGQSQET